MIGIGSGSEHRERRQSQTRRHRSRRPLPLRISPGYCCALRRRETGGSGTWGDGESNSMASTHPHSGNQMATAGRRRRLRQWQLPRCGRGSRGRRDIWRRRKPNPGGRSPQARTRAASPGGYRKTLVVRSDIGAATAPPKATSSEKPGRATGRRIVLATNLHTAPNCRTSASRRRASTVRSPDPKSAAQFRKAPPHAADPSASPPDRTAGGKACSNRQAIRLTAPRLRP